MGKHPALMLVHQCAPFQSSSTCILWSSLHPMKVVGVCRNQDPRPGRLPSPTLQSSQRQTDRQCTRATTMRNSVLLKPSPLSSPQLCQGLLYLVTFLKSGTWPCLCSKGGQSHRWLWRNCLLGAGNDTQPYMVNCTIQLTKDFHTHL